MKIFQVRRVADQCLDVIMDTDEEWAVRIRNLKFESFNQEWLDVVAAPPGQVCTLTCRLVGWWVGWLVGMGDTVSRTFHIGHVVVC